MNITIDQKLTTEEQDALTAKVAQRNQSLSPGQAPYTLHSHLEEVLKAEVHSITEEAYASSVRRVGEMFRSKPYDVRLATIAQLEQTAE